jgi:hypothetical protein
LILYHETMRKPIARLRGAGFILWHARHELYHALLGYMWALIVLRSLHHVTASYIWISILAALLPDLDHFFFFFSYGKNDPYTRNIVILLKGKKWRKLTVYIEKGHKHNIRLSTHNIYFTTLLILACIISIQRNWLMGIIILGAAASHYLFDIADDFMTLGYLNPNWKRWGPGKVKNSVEGI